MKLQEMHLLIVRSDETELTIGIEPLRGVILSKIDSRGVHRVPAPTLVWDRQGQPRIVPSDILESAIELANLIDHAESIGRASALTTRTAEIPWSATLSFEEHLSELRRKAEQEARDRAAARE